MTVTPKSLPLKSMPLKSTALQRGLSLVELVAVLAIIGVLTSISVPMYSEYITRSKVMTAYEILTDKQKEILNYLNDNGTILDKNACGSAIGFDNKYENLSTADWKIYCQPKTHNTWLLKADGVSPALKDSNGKYPVQIAVTELTRNFNGYSIGWMGTTESLLYPCWPTSKKQTTCPSGS